MRCARDRRRVKTLSLLLLLGFLSITTWIGSPAFALDPNRHISQYAHTAWRVQDGVFNIPTAITQTTDGYLWFGTQFGLTRFDGVRFVPWHPPDGGQLMSPRIDSLLGAHDGSLWIGTAGGLSHWQNQHLTNYVDEPGVVASMVQSRTGSIWIALTHSSALTNSTDGASPLCEVVRMEMRCHGPAEGVPSKLDSTVAEDGQGNIWLGGSTALVRWTPESHDIYSPHGLESNSGMLGVSSVAPRPDGSSWVGMASVGRGLGLQRLEKGIWKPFVTPGLDGRTISVEQLLLDRENALWVATSKQGLYRIYGDKVEHFGTANGLSSDGVRRVFEDREGNVWIVTTRGIDNFRNVRIASFSTEEGLSTTEVDSVSSSRDGAVWVGGFEALDVLRGSGSSVVEGKRLSGDQVTSIFEDHAGRLWVGVNNTLTIYKDGRFREIKKRNGSPTGMIVGITEDTDNNLWVESRGTPMTLIRIRDFECQEEFVAPRMPAARRLAPDPEGGIWLGLMNGDLARYQHGRIETFHFQHTPDSRVEQINVEPDGSVLAATAFGLIGWAHGKQMTLTARNGLPCDSVYAFVSDRQGNLWLNTQCGMVEISTAEMHRWRDNPDRVLDIKIFDVFDGAQPGRAPFVSAARSSDGRLWFADGMVLQMVDPDHMAGNTVSPPVHVEGLIADRRSLAPRDGFSLPPRTRDLEVDYTALSFIAPQKVRFRYKLEGYDTEWQEAGSRRQAFYTDLPPRHYLFRVIACNNDGLWNEAGDTLNFSVTPTFYQTVWFKLICFAAATGILWLAYFFRLKQATAQIQQRLGARLEERERIARELHDTLLQGFQGLVLRIHAVMKILPDHESARQMMEKVLDRADEVLLEGRQSVRDLREEGASGNELSEALMSCGEELSQDHTSVFSLAVVGTPKALGPIVFNEVYRIAREALGNAFRHSNASKIEVELTYDSARVCVSIRDNGTGMDQQILNGGKTGHWGLSGMRERAQKIGAQLNIWSSRGAGTEIEIAVPANVAYPRVEKASLWQRIKRATKITGRGIEP
jgi:signal transduction histidine kinase/ligand-binding sensor domain-containing protein